MLCIYSGTCPIWHLCINQHSLKSALEMYTSLIQNSATLQSSMDVSVPIGQKTSINWQSLKMFFDWHSKTCKNERYFCCFCPFQLAIFQWCNAKYKADLKVNNDVVFRFKCTTFAAVCMWFIIDLQTIIEKNTAFAKLINLHHYTPYWVVFYSALLWLHTHIMTDSVYIWKCFVIFYHQNFMISECWYQKPL